MPKDSGEFQVELLLAPITEANPTGVDLRQENSSNSLYYQIKDTRTQARNIERRAEGSNQAMDAKTYWQMLMQLANNALKDYSKDLEIAVWLTEALVRIKGFSGLAQGFCLLRELITEFWEQLYPLPDEDGIENRVTPLAGLNGVDGEGALIIPIRSVLLTAGNDYGSFSEWQYQQAVQINQILDPEKRKMRVEASGLSLESIEKSARNTAPQFFHQTYFELQQAIEEFNQLVSVLNEYFGEQSPPTSAINNTLQDCLAALKFLAQGKLSLAEEEKNTTNEINEVNQQTDVTLFKQQPATAMTRAHAFKQLQQIASYFRETEPHSPLSYAIEQAIRWGNTPLPQLLSELIPDVNARDNLFALTGIPIIVPEQEH